MSKQLKHGAGLCSGKHVLLIEPVHVAVELGAGPDIVQAVCNAVHHSNRQGEHDDRIALTFPKMRVNRDGLSSGYQLELIGSAKNLEALIQLDGVEKLKRRGMIESLSVMETEVEPGAIGAAYIRVRTGEKYTPGGQRRMKARAERRGIKLKGKAKSVRQHSDFTLLVGTTPIHITQCVLPMSDTPLLVTTYGLSSPSAPAVMPIRPTVNNGIETAA